MSASGVVVLTVTQDWVEVGVGGDGERLKGIDAGDSQGIVCCRAGTVAGGRGIEKVELVDLLLLVPLAPLLGAIRGSVRGGGGEAGPVCGDVGADDAASVIAQGVAIVNEAEAGVLRHWSRVAQRTDAACRCVGRVM